MSVAATGRKLEVSVATTDSGIVEHVYRLRPISRFAERISDQWTRGFRLFGSDMSHMREVMVELSDGWVERGLFATPFALLTAEQLLNSLGIMEPDSDFCPVMQGSPRGAIDMYWREQGRNLVIHVPADPKGAGHTYYFEDGNDADDVVNGIPSAEQARTALNRVFIQAQ